MNKDIIQRRQIELRRLRQEIRKGLEVIRALKEGSEIIVSLGGGIYAKVKNVEGLLVDSGVGVLFERDVNSVERRLQDSLKRLEEELETLQREGNKDEADREDSGEA